MLIPWRVLYQQPSPLTRGVLVLHCARRFCKWDIARGPEREPGSHLLRIKGGWISRESGHHQWGNGNKLSQHDGRL